MNRECWGCDDPEGEIDELNFCRKCAAAQEEEYIRDGVISAWIQLFAAYRSGEDVNKVLMQLADPETLESAAAQARRNADGLTKRQRELNLMTADHLEALAVARRGVGG